jgi:hypothetical protein
MRALLKHGLLAGIAIIVAAIVCTSIADRGEAASRQAQAIEMASAYQRLLDESLAAADPRDDAAVARAKRDAIRRILLALPTWTPSNAKPNARFVYFRTDAPGIVVPADQRTKYPTLMSVVLQHQYRNLRVSADTIVVTLSFNGIWQTLTIPLAAVTSFEDRTARFTIDIDDAGPTQRQAPVHEQQSQHVDPQRSGAMSAPSPIAPRCQCRWNSPRAASQGA